MITMNHLKYDKISKTQWEGISHLKKRKIDFVSLKKLIFFLTHSAVGRRKSPKSHIFGIVFFVKIFDFFCQNKRLLQ
jgi:hypothetical protein